jgi:hypothetical protein
MAHQQHEPSRNVLDPWREAFVLELRLAHVDGRAVGDALAQVDSHCAESGRDPQEAFGDPARYAADIAAALDPALHVPRPTWWRTVVLGTGTGLGFAALLRGVEGLAHDRPAIISLGLALGAAIVPVVATGVMSLLERSTRSGRHAPFVLGATVGIVACTLPPLLLQRSIASLPASAAVTFGGLVLVALLIGIVLPLRSHQDRLIDPRTGQEPFRVPGRVKVLLWALPASLVAMAVLATALAR